MSLDGSAYLDEANEILESVKGKKLITKEEQNEMLSGIF